MKNYIQPGDTLDVTAPYALSSGDGCLVGVIFGVSVATYLISATAQIKTMGVFDLTRTTGASSGWAAGVLIYWDDTAKKITKTAASNKIIGVSVDTTGDSDTTGRVRLMGSFFAS